MIRDIVIIVICAIEYSKGNPKVQKPPTTNSVGIQPASWQSEFT